MKVYQQLTTEQKIVSKELASCLFQVYATRRDMEGLIDFATSLKTGMVVEDLAKAVEALISEENYQLAMKQYKSNPQNEVISLIALRVCTKLGDIDNSRDIFTYLQAKNALAKWWMIELFTKKRETAELRKIFQHLKGTIGELNTYFLPYLEPKDLLSEAAASFFALRNGSPQKKLEKTELKDLENILLSI